MRQLLRLIKEQLTPQAWLAPDALATRRADRGGLPANDPGADAVVAACTAWLCAAQDQSASADGGVARHFSLLTGWATSYPETTGYIVPTMIELARRQGNDELHQRSRRMLDWLLAIQFPDGGFQGGRIDSTPRVPVTFNTGQILLGLAAGAHEYGDLRYHAAMHRAAAWLRDSLDADGCWRRHPTPFAAPGDKAYETHVAWGLFAAERVAPGHGYGEAGLRQVAWALTRQQPNGWFASNCLDDPKRPLSHTIGYALRGVLEAFLLCRQPELLAAAARTGSALRQAVGADGFLPGRLDRHWRPAASFACLTGSAQIAHCMLLLYQLTSEQHYFEAGQRLIRYVRRSVAIEGPQETRGGVKGAFPVDGDYGRFEYLNWAAKFCIDANLLEQDILKTRRAALAADLARLGIAQGDTLFIHSSLKSLGYVEGGAGNLLLALQEAVGPEGTLVLPTYYMPGGSIRAACELKNYVFDVRRHGTHSGRLPEAFLAIAGIHRSVHPTHSVSAWGRHAAYLTEAHHRAPSIFGAGSPWQRLAGLDNAKVLGLGVSMGPVTFYHTVEDAMGQAFPLPVWSERSYLLPCIDQQGRRHDVPLRAFDPLLAQRRIDHPSRSDLRNYFVTEFQGAGLLHRNQVGMAACWWIPARGFHEHLWRLAKNGVTIYATPEQLAARPQV